MAWVVPRVSAFYVLAAWSLPIPFLQNTVFIAWPIALWSSCATLPILQSPAPSWGPLWPLEATGMSLLECHIKYHLRCLLEQVCFTAAHHLFIFPSSLDAPWGRQHELHISKSPRRPQTQNYSHRKHWCQYSTGNMTLESNCLRLDSHSPASVQIINNSKLFTLSFLKKWTLSKNMHIKCIAYNKHWRNIKLCFCVLKDYLFIL